MSWAALPPELAEIKARLDILDARADTPNESPRDLDEWHTLRLQYTEIAGPLGICNTTRCLNQKQADKPWCAPDQAMADEILTEILAEEASGSV